MAAREYVYVRRVWPRVGDGGCYSVSRACGHAAAPPPHGVLGRDFAAAMLIRDARSCRGSAHGVLCCLCSCATRPVCHLGVLSPLWTPFCTIAPILVKECHEKHQISLLNCPCQRLAIAMVDPPDLFYCCRRGGDNFSVL